MNADLWQNKTDELWKFSENLTEICILGALWLICSLPIVTIGAATTAMYTVFMCRITHERKKLVKPFFAAFKEKFKKSTIMWMIIFPVMVLLVVDTYYYLYLYSSSIFHRTMGITMLCLLVIVMFVSSYAFPLIAMYNNTIKDTLIESIHHSYFNWPWTLLTFAVNMAVFALMAIGLWHFAFLFVGIAGYAKSRIMIKAIGRDIPSGRE